MALMAYTAPSVQPIEYNYTITYLQTPQGPPQRPHMLFNTHAQLDLVEEVEVVQRRGGVRETSLHRETEESHHSQTRVLDLRRLQLNRAVGLVCQTCIHQPNRQSV